MTIKAVFRPVISVLSSMFSIQHLIDMTGQATIFPFYHIVTDHPPSHIKGSYQIISTAQFESDLEWLLKYYEPMDIGDFLNNKTNRRKQGFVLTFDDGLREFHDIIVPILLKKGIPSICFINTGFVDNRDMFYRYKINVLTDFLGRNEGKLSSLSRHLHKKDTCQLIHELRSMSYQNRGTLDLWAEYVGLSFDQYLQDHQPYMSTVQIRSLAGQGIYFGAHSIDHPRYDTIPLSDQIRQTEESLSWIKHHLDPPYSLFSFPFTDYGVTSSFFDYFYKSKSPIDATFGTAGIKQDAAPNHYQRIPMDVDNRTAYTILKNEYMYYFLKSFVGKNCIKRHD